MQVLVCLLVERSVVRNAHPVVVGCTIAVLKPRFIPRIPQECTFHTIESECLTLSFDFRHDRIVLDFPTCF